MRGSQSAVLATVVEVAVHEVGRHLHERERAARKAAKKGKKRDA